MLHAISLNKAGRNLDSGEVHWNQLFNSSEDSLTSTIFALLFYLPNELLWHIISNACYDEKLLEASLITSYEFWPRWIVDGSHSASYIEPDIFIRTAKYDLIIEAKRYDYDQQSSAQWEREFQAYLQQYSEEQKNVFLLAIGGINSEKITCLTHGNKRTYVIKCRWARLLNEVKKAITRLENSRGLLNNVDSSINILNDLVLGFRIHGYSTGEWFENTKLTTINQASLIVLKENEQTFR